MKSPSNPWTNEEREEIDTRIMLANSVGCQLSDEMIEGMAMFATTLRVYGVLLHNEIYAGEERLVPLLKNVERILLP